MNSAGNLRSHALRRIGTVPVGAVALGCASLSFDHADDPARAAEVIDAALDAGIGVLDTAAAYTVPGVARHNETLIATVLARRPSDRARALVMTKGGHYRDGDAFPVDARPATLRRHCEQSLDALGVECIDLYFLHWPDPSVAIEESIGALDELRREGKIARIGVSNVDAAQLAAAQRTAPIAAVQNRFSLFDRSGEDVLDQCSAASTAYLAYSPLRGLAQAAPDLAVCIGRIASLRGVGAARVALAWLLGRSPVVIPVVGATRVPTAQDAAAAADLVLDPAELADLESACGGLDTA